MLCRGFKAKHTCAMLSPTSTQTIALKVDIPNLEWVRGTISMTSWWRHHQLLITITMIQSLLFRKIISLEQHNGGIFTINVSPERSWTLNEMKFLNHESRFFIFQPSIDFYFVILTGCYINRMFSCQLHGVWCCECACDSCYKRSLGLIMRVYTYMHLHPYTTQVMHATEKIVKHVCLIWVLLPQTYIKHSYLTNKAKSLTRCTCNIIIHVQPWNWHNSWTLFILS